MLLPLRKNQNKPCLLLPLSIGHRWGMRPLLTYMSSFLREARVLLHNFCLWTMRSIPSMLCCLCSNTKQVNHGDATFYVLYFLIYVMMPVFYNTWCGTCFFWCTMNFNERISVSSMRWEGGLIAYFNVPCHYKFPTHSFQVEFVPTLGETIEAQCSAKCEMKCKINDTNVNQLQCSNIQSSFESRFSPVIARRKRVISDVRLCVSNPCRFAKISQINYLESMRLVWFMHAIYHDIILDTKGFVWIPRSR